MIALKSRYDAFAQRVLASLSEIERRDVRAFDRWFYANGGWRWLIGVVIVTTLIAWVASQLPWNMSFAEAAILFNLVVLTLIWSGLSAWFGYRRFQGRIFRYIVAGPLLALAGALVGASIAGLVQGVDPFAFVQDSAKLRHVITAGLVFGFLFAFVTDTGVGLAAALAGRGGIRTPLKDLLAGLDPEKFWQVHRGTIVNLDAVTGVLREDAERQFVLLKNRQEKLPISRQFTHLFKQM